MQSGQKDPFLPSPGLKSTSVCFGKALCQQKSSHMPTASAGRMMMHRYVQQHGIAALPARQHQIVT